MNPDYDHLVKAAKRLHFRSRFEAVYYCVGYYKAVDEELLDMIQKLYEENFIEE